MNILVILIWLTFMFGVGVFVLASVGGSFLLTRLKSRMPFWKGKGKHILFFDKSGKSRFYYLIPNDDGKVTVRGVIYNIISTDHSLSDNTNGKGTVHFLDGEPLYILVQGCPNNVLARQRDYDLDVGKISSIITSIDKLVNDEKVEPANEYINKLAKATFKLTGSYKYLKPARKVISELILLTKNYEAGELNKYSVFKVLNTYKVILQKLQRILESRNRTMINFTDYFTANDLNQSFNDQFSNALALKSVEAERMKNGMNKFTKLGVGVGIAVVGVLAFLLIQQGGTIDEMQLTMNTINSNIIELKADIDVTPVVLDAGVNGSPVPVNDMNTNNK